MEVVFKMPIFTFNNANIGFLNKELTWKTYSIVEALLTTKKVQIIDWKEFAKAGLDPNKEAFVVYIVTITSKMTIYPEHKAQITLLKAKEAPVSVPAEYSDFANVFSEKLTAVLLKHIEINTLAINLKELKQPPYRPIYSLDLLELETLKIYIKTNMASNFICFSKSPADTPILFDRKLDGSF